MYRVQTSHFNTHRNGHVLICWNTFPYMLANFSSSCEKETESTIYRNKHSKGHNKKAIKINKNKMYKKNYAQHTCNKRLLCCALNVTALVKRGGKHQQRQQLYTHHTLTLKLTMKQNRKKQWDQGNKKQQWQQQILLSLLHSLCCWAAGMMIFSVRCGIFGYVSLTCVLSLYIVLEST